MKTLRMMMRASRSGTPAFAFQPTDPRSLKQFPGAFRTRRKISFEHLQKKPKTVVTPQTKQVG